MNNSPAPPELGNILDHAPCGFLRFNDEGTVLLVNATLVEMLDRSASDIEGEHASTLFDQPAKVFLQTYFFPTLRMRGRVDELQMSLLSQCGKKIPVLINAVRRESSGVISNDCIIVGVEERERFEEDLLRAKRDAEQAHQSREDALNRLKEANQALALAKDEADAASSAKDAFLAALSHELRTPLTPVLLTISELEKSDSLSAPIREQLSMVRRNVELEATLIDDLLDVTRIRHGKLTLNRSPIDLHLVLDQAREIVMNDIEEKGITLTLRPDAPHHHVNGDAARIEQVIWNLLKNAAKFTPEQGAITVATRCDDQEGIIVEVTDSGVGISSTQIRNIFQQFEQGHATGKHRFGGLGLGLSISQAIIQAHGGKIWAESKGEGKGAKFSFSLKTTDKLDQTRPEETGDTGDSSSIEQMHILLVEDHESTRMVIARLLTEMNHQVTAVGTLAAAESAFHAGEIDLVISDLGLPDGSGLDLMKTIRSSSKVPSIALSGFGMPEDVQRMADAGFTAHLIKPIKIDQLITQLHKIRHS